MNVAAIMPPITAIPIAFCAAEPAPLDVARGVTPRMKAKEVMIIGRNLILQASKVASNKS